MSLFDGIGNVVSSATSWRANQAVTPGQDAAGRQRLAPAFRTTFQNRISTVLAEAAGGRFDDPEISARMDALTARLRARAGADVVAGGGRAGGALAAPRVLANEEEARQLLQLQHQQASARLRRVSSSMADSRQVVASNAKVASADLHRFKPTSEAEAAVYAERLVVELTEGVARLDAKATELELARYELDNSVPGASAARVAQLEAEHAAVEQHVLAVASTVDDMSSDAVSRGPGVPAAQTRALVAEAARNGVDAQDIATLTKALAIAQDESVTGDSRIARALQETLRTELVAEMMRHQNRRDRERAAEEQRAYERKRGDQRAEGRQLAKRAQLQADNERAAQRQREIAAMYSRPARSA